MAAPRDKQARTVKKRARRPAPDPLTRVRQICQKLGDVVEKEAWRAPTFRVAGGKMFAMFLDHHHGDGRIAVWCMAPSGAQATLVAADPERFFVPPYVGPSGWLGIRLDRRLDWGTIADLLADAYREALLDPPARSRRRGKAGKASAG